MNSVLPNIFKGVVWLAIIFIAINGIHNYINTSINLRLYEEMAKKYNCQFLTASASRSDVGMFQCDGKIVFKKLED